MKDVFSMLPEVVKEQQCFIFDHGKIENGTLKYQDDFNSYGWNLRQFNKVKEGAFVLFRKPGRATKNKKFEIFGGGYISKITIDKQKNAVAEITHAFEINPPIRQGELFIETFQWNSKNKKNNSWSHFWNQYGMNRISFLDFQNLLKGRRCIPLEKKTKVEQDYVTLDEKTNTDIANELRPFQINFDGAMKSNRKKRKKSNNQVVKVDWEKIQAAKNRTGECGEEIVLEYLIEEAKKNKQKMPVHVSKEEGDGLGYDIRAWDIDGCEKHIEVKTTTGVYPDGFEMTSNEVEVSEKDKDNYLIYRVYNLDIESRKCDIKIYSGPVNKEHFEIKVMSVRVNQK